METEHWGYLLVGLKVILFTLTSHLQIIPPLFLFLSYTYSHTY